MTADYLLKIAAAEIGNVEKPMNSNKVKYNTWFYGSEVYDGFAGDKYPWCMTFVQWCYTMAGEPLPYKTASCSALLNWYERKAPHLITKDPVPGAIIIYSFGHTGILESAEGDTITAIEGNTSSDYNGSQSNGGGVFRRVRKAKLASAYILPVNFETENPDPETEDKDMTPEKLAEMLPAAFAILAKKEATPWAQEALDYCKENGYMVGDETGNQQPMKPLIRQEAAQIIMKIMTKS